MHAEIHDGLDVRVLLLLADFNQNWKWSLIFLRTVQGVQMEAKGTSEKVLRIYQLHGVTFQTIAILTLKISTSSDERVSQSLIQKLMYAYIQSIRIQGHPPISHFTLISPEKLYCNGFKSHSGHTVDGAYGLGPQKY
jgi:hypothetical protein